MSECYCERHQTTNHSYGSAYCEVWEAAMKDERARIEKGVRVLVWMQASSPSVFGPAGEPMLRRESVLRVITDTMPDLPTLDADDIERGMHEEGAG